MKLQDLVKQDLLNPYALYGICDHFRIPAHTPVEVVYSDHNQYRVAIMPQVTSFHHEEIEIVPYVEVNAVTIEFEKFVFFDEVIHVGYSPILNKVYLRKPNIIGQSIERDISKIANELSRLQQFLKNSRKKDWERKYNESILQWGDRLFYDGHLDDPKIRVKYQAEVYKLSFSFMLKLFGKVRSNK